MHRPGSKRNTRLAGLLLPLLAPPEAREGNTVRHSLAAWWLPSDPHPLSIFHPPR